MRPSLPGDHRSGRLHSPADATGPSRSVSGWAEPRPAFSSDDTSLHALITNLGCGGRIRIVDMRAYPQTLRIGQEGSKQCPTVSCWR